ncbi:outer membrane protein assembly factor BamE, partial [Thermodesulfobacteriota bacterium]
GEMKKDIVILSILMIVFFSGCTPASQHRQEVQGDDKGGLTVGKVQREIRVGMSSSEVVEVLGSPNVVTTDEQRREVWVYDKISTERAYSTSSGGISVLILGAFGESGASSSTQKTLTVIIKFDNEKKVRDFAYRQSTF